MGKSGDTERQEALIEGIGRAFDEWLMMRAFGVDELVGDGIGGNKGMAQ